MLRGNKNKAALLSILFLSLTCFSKADESPSSQPESWNIHFQTTLLPQYHGSFPAKYSGSNSLSPGPEMEASLTATLFFGVRLWDGGAFYLDPECAAGNGFSDVAGIASFPNGDVLRASEAPLNVNLSRVYLEQTFGLGGDREMVGDGPNQLAGERDTPRLTVVAGKFCLADFFDGNAYAHDARTQFFNWSLVDNTAWDFAADVQGYTFGVMVELNQKDWAFRICEALMTTVAVGTDFDASYPRARGDNAELEWRYDQGANPGTVRLLGYLNQADMGNYQQAIEAYPPAPDVTQTRAYRDKLGWGLSWDQALNKELGVFGRLGWNDGNKEAFEQTSVDQMESLGAVLTGNSWGRPDDQVGLGVVVTHLSRFHQIYLSLGGLDFLIGDGTLNYAPEGAVEIYYLYKPIEPLGLTLDLQGVNNPAYNQDRGPVGILSFRAHLEL